MCAACARDALVVQILKKKKNEKKNSGLYGGVGWVMKMNSDHGEVCLVRQRMGRTDGPRKGRKEGRGGRTTTVVVVGAYEDRTMPFRYGPYGLRPYVWRNGLDSLASREGGHNLFWRSRLCHIVEVERRKRRKEEGGGIGGKERRNLSARCISRSTATFLRRLRFSEYSCA